MAWSINTFIPHKTTSFRGVCIHCNPYQATVRTKVAGCGALMLDQSRRGWGTQVTMTVLEKAKQWQRLGVESVLFFLKGVDSFWSWFLWMRPWAVRAGLRRC